MQTDRQVRHKKLFSSRRSKGFTLAEILLVITIIGIIASYTIPPLAISIQKQRYTAALLKNYSIFANAYKLLDADGTTMEAAFPGTTWVAALNKIAPKLNIIKNCGSSMGCFYNSPAYNLNGTPSSADLDTSWNNAYGKAILADGTMILIVDNGSKCTTPEGTGPLLQTCGELCIDVNGAKNPNTIGRDFFFFWITKTGVYPYGSNGDSNTCTTSGSGTGCANTVLTQGMNY